MIVVVGIGGGITLFAIGLSINPHAPSTSAIQNGRHLVAQVVSADGGLRTGGYVLNVSYEYKNRAYVEQVSDGRDFHGRVPKSEVIVIDPLSPSFPEVPGQPESGPESGAGIIVTGVISMGVGLLMTIHLLRKVTRYRYQG
jgi:hypothetical protein